MYWIEDPAQELFSRVYLRYLEPETFPPAQLVDWLDTLPYITAEQREVLRLRTGLADGYRYSLEEVAEMRHMSRPSIHQIEQRAIRCLRHAHGDEIADRRLAHETSL